MVSYVASLALFFPFLGIVQDLPVPKNGAIVELFEDDTEGLLNLLTNPGDGPGRGAAESSGVFSGKTCLIGQRHF